MSDASAKSAIDEIKAQDEVERISEQMLEQIRSRAARVRQEVGRVVIGSAEAVDALLVALFAGGHILLEGVPGVAKTTLCRSFAATLGAEFRRIQFTPDLLPADITGTYVPDLRTNEFHLRKGPIFTNILLGDEINRAPTKTQSALLEAMQEGQVTIEGHTHTLERPFLVLATQNPIEQQGVYPLPEAQLDRFLLKVRIRYPSAQEEIDILRTHRQEPPPLEQIWSAEEIYEVMKLVEKVHATEEIMSYIVALNRQTRRDKRVLLGASPRASLALLKAAQARALIQGRDYVLPDDIQVLAETILAHRLLLHPDAELDGASVSQIIKSALGSVRYG